MCFFYSAFSILWSKEALRDQRWSDVARSESENPRPKMLRGSRVALPGGRPNPSRLLPSTPFPSPHRCPRRSPASRATVTAAARCIPAAFPGWGFGRRAAALDGGHAGGSPASYVAEVLAVLPGRVDGGGCSRGRSWQGVSSSSS
jgi:hypothetical protein